MCPGAWVSDIMEGRGMYLYPDDGMYDGDFVQGNREGLGTHKYPNGKLDMTTVFV